MFIKALLLGAQKKMMNILLETGRKRTLVIRAESFAELCSTVTEKAELKSNELGCLDKISKQSIEGAA